MATRFRAQTGGELASSHPPIQPHLRFISSPDFRQASHSQPAWLENKKWKATISFFVLLRSARSPPELPPGPLETILRDRNSPAILVSPGCHPIRDRIRHATPKPDTAARSPRARAPHPSFRKAPAPHPEIPSGPPVPESAASIPAAAQTTSEP